MGIDFYLDCAPRGKPAPQVRRRALRRPAFAIGVRCHSRANGAGVIGSITVSGLAQREDHGLIVETLCALLGHDHATLALVHEDGE
uniref:hypothetical protein n=1 Tax=Paraburkholderia agricolaris TaxID=2152888 RepID=UPI0038B94209